MRTLGSEGSVGVPRFLRPEQLHTETLSPVRTSDGSMPAVPVVVDGADVRYAYHLSVVARSVACSYRLRISLDAALR